MADEEQYFIELGTGDLGGLPDFLLQAAKQAGVFSFSSLWIKFRYQDVVSIVTPLQLVCDSQLILLITI